MAKENLKLIGKVKLTQYEISLAYSHLYDEFGPIIQIWTEEKKNQCELMYLQGIAIKEISREIQISVRAIQFFLFPERLEACKERRKERGGSKIYYDTEKQKESMKEHRAYMKKLNEEGKI